MRIPVHDRETSTLVRGFLHTFRNLYRLVLQMAADLTDLKALVAENTTVVASAVTLLDSLADQLEAAAGDPAEVQAIVDQLRVDKDALAAAVSENTPAAEPTPEPLPEDPAPVDPPVEG